MELIDTPNPNAKKIETTIEQDEVKKFKYKKRRNTKKFL